MNNVGQMVCKIVEAKRTYYRDGKPIMSDYDYDKLEIELRKIDPDHPILSMVGYDESYEWWVRHYETLAGMVQGDPLKIPNQPIKPYNQGRV